MRYAGETFALGDIVPCDAAIMQACHDDYKAIDWGQVAQMGCKVVLDGRNCLDRQEIERAGMTYIGMGR
jgi:UDPglucose 6-dehydrogenase